MEAPATEPWTGRAWIMALVWPMRCRRGQKAVAPCQATLRSAPRGCVRAGSRTRAASGTWPSRAAGTLGTAKPGSVATVDDPRDGRGGAQAREPTDGHHRGRHTPQAFAVGGEGSKDGP